MGFREQFRSRPLSLRSRSRLALRLEELESRTLLSVAGAASYLASPAVIYDPSQIQHTYQFDKIANLGISGAGAGQTIAIIDAYDDPTVLSDLQAFDKQLGLADPPSFNKVVQVVNGAPPPTDSGWALEISLDVQWAHAMAPAANILLVEANSPSLNDLLSAVDYASSNGASVVSMSWGSGEFSTEALYDSHFGAAGITYVASSGDNGAYYGLSWPAAAADVVSVGGTSLTLNSSGGNGSETGWSGSGGGASAVETRPSYQSTYLSSHANSVPSRILKGHARLNPDVAYNADPNKGYYVYDSVPYNGSTGWWQVGGTSAAAPQWAALVAIADQVRVANGQGPLSSTSTLTALYGVLAATSTSYASNYHDVKTGNNGYNAGTGFDLVTGLGSPLANNVVAALATVSSSGHAAVAASSSGATPGSAQHVVSVSDTPSSQLSPSDVRLILALLSAATERAPAVLPAAPQVAANPPVAADPNLPRVSLSPNRITISVTRDAGSGGWLVIDREDDDDAAIVSPGEAGSVPAPPSSLPASSEKAVNDRTESGCQVFAPFATGCALSAFSSEATAGPTMATTLVEDHEALQVADPLAAGVSCAIVFGGYIGTRLQELEERERRRKPNKV